MFIGLPRFGSQEQASSCLLNLLCAAQMKSCKLELCAPSNCETHTAQVAKPDLATVSLAQLSGSQTSSEHERRIAYTC